MFSIVVRIQIKMMTMLFKVVLLTHYDLHRIYYTYDIHSIPSIEGYLLRLFVCPELKRLYLSTYL